MLCALVLIALCAPDAGAAPAPVPKVVAIKAARLFDGVSEKLIAPGLVVVSEGKITAVSGAVPSGAEVIDLGDATLLPGLIDAHTHLTYPHQEDWRKAWVDGEQKPIAQQAIEATAQRAGDTDGRLHHRSRLALSW
jgi:imidazolonepropionase-like amidohydrolase